MCGLKNYDKYKNRGRKNKRKTESGEFDDLPDDTPVDSRITYPSYKSFDEFIDTDRLRSLDGYLTQKIKRRLNAQEDLKFYTGPYKLNGETPDRPGSRMIYLAYSELPDSYFDLDRTELWHPTIHANEFALLMDFIKTLPFAATGRMLIMYDDVARQVPAHRDHIETELCHEFLWFRTNLKKPFFMLNQKTGEKKYVEGYTRVVRFGQSISRLGRLRRFIVQHSRGRKIYRRISKQHSETGIQFSVNAFILGGATE